MKKIVLLLFVFANFCMAAVTGGTYTMGPGGDYANILELSTDLYDQTLTDDVIIEFTGDIVQTSGDRGQLTFNAAGYSFTIDGKGYKYTSSCTRQTFYFSSCTNVDTAYIQNLELVCNANIGGYAYWAFNAPGHYVIRNCKTTLEVVSTGHIFFFNTNVTSGTVTNHYAYVDIPSGASGNFIISPYGTAQNVTVENTLCYVADNSMTLAISGSYNNSTFRNVALLGFSSSCFTQDAGITDINLMTTDDDGSSGLINVTALEQFESFTPSMIPLPVQGSLADTGGVQPTLEAQDVNLINWASPWTIGPKQWVNTDYAIAVFKIGDQGSNGRYCDGELIEIIDPNESADAAGNYSLSDEMQTIFYCRKIPLNKKERYRGYYQGAASTKCILRPSRLTGQQLALLRNSGAKKSLVDIDESVYDYGDNLPANPAQLDENAWVGGAVTVGSGGDYATWLALSADVGTFTSDGTATGISDVTGTASATFSAALNYTIELNGGGYVYDYGGDIYAIRLTTEGASSVTRVNNFIFERTSSASNPASFPAVYIASVSTSNIPYHINNNMFYGGGYIGVGIRCTDNSPILSVYDNVLVDFSGDAGSYAIRIDPTDGNSSSIYENNTCYNSITGMNLSSNAGYVINNACFDNTTDFDNTESLTTFSNCASSDATGSEAGLRSLTAADEFRSTTSTNAYFLEPKGTGELYLGGSDPTISDNTTYYNSIPIVDGSVNIGANGYMDIDTTNPDYFELLYTASVAGPYEKNGNAGLGWYYRHVSNVNTKEVLLDVDISGIPSDATIYRVQVKFDIQSNNLAANLVSAKLFEQDKNTWTDDGSTTPIFTTFPVSVWDTELSEITGLNNASTGTQTFESSDTTVNLFQDFIDSVKVEDDGLIISMNANTTSWWLDVNNIEVEVAYTAPAAPPPSGGSTSTGNKYFRFSNSFMEWSKRLLRLQ